MFDDSTGQYLVGIVLALLMLVPLALGSRALRARLLPQWTGPEGSLASIIVFLGSITALSYLLGVAGRLERVPLTVGGAVAGAAMWALCRQHPDDIDAHVRTPLVRRPEPGAIGYVFGAVATIVAFGAWGGRTIEAVRHGMVTIDTMWYHLPDAARWAQTGDLLPLHFLDPGEPLLTFYPANGPIFHALGMTFLDSDVVSPFLNLGWLALALFAAWCAGRSVGAGTLALGGVAAVLTMPVALGTLPGGGYADIVGIAFLLAAVAVLAAGAGNGREIETPAIALAGLAAGLALGTKFQFVLPVAGLILGLAMLPPRVGRWRRSAVFAASVIVTGAFWYVRNLALAGSPAPGSPIDIGPIHLPSPPITTPMASLASYLGTRSNWDEWVFPGLGAAFARGWWLGVVVVVCGCAVGLVRGGIPRVVAIATVVSIAGFVVSPARYSWVDGGEPTLLTVSLRYLLPPLTLAFITAAMVAGARKAWAVAFVGVVTVFVGISLVERTRWPEIHELDYQEAIWQPKVLAALAVTALVAIGGWGLSRIARGRGVRMAAVVAGALVIAASVPLHAWYVDHWYKDPGGIAPLLHFDWATDLTDQRIALVGTSFRYPFYGVDQSNHVQYVGIEGPRGAFRAADSCEEWRRALNDGRYDYVATHGSVSANEAAWTASDDGVAIVEHAEGPFFPWSPVTVFRIDRPLNPESCGEVEQG